MKTKYFMVCLLILTLILPTLGRRNVLEPDNKPFVFEEPKGVVLLDDIHQNDYADGSLDLVVQDLESKGYVPQYASNFSTWAEALSFSHYLVMTAPYSAVPASDIDAINDWMQNGSRNLLIASRGDFEAVNTDSINQILSTINAGTRVNHDNVYTTDPSARREWYIETNNFNQEYSFLFDGVDSINFFSPSSVIPGTNASVLINA